MLFCWFLFLSYLLNNTYACWVQHERLHNCNTKKYSIRSGKLRNCRVPRNLYILILILLSFNLTVELSNEKYIIYEYILF